MVGAMPAKYTQRHFVNGGHYHIYNRGVEKRQIFFDEQDYRMFQYYLFIYLAPPLIVQDKYPNLPAHLKRNSQYANVLLETYTLMPNHFHLLLQQQTDGAISQFVKQLTNAYTLYFNQKYQRVGSLMQGVFKAVEIDSGSALLHVSRYIHRNPVSAGIARESEAYPWSSYEHFIGPKINPFVESGNILSAFVSAKMYADFVEGQQHLANLDTLFIDHDE
jgi:putative transposase